MKKRLWAAVFGTLALVLAVCVAGCGGKDEGDAADAYTQGRIELEQGNVQKAVTLLQKAAAEKPKDATITYWLGESYRQGNAFKEAINEFERALEYDPTAVRAHLKIAECEMVLGRKARGTGPSAKDELAHYLNAERHCNKALTYLEKETLAKPDDEALQQMLGEACMTLGKVYKMSGREDEALAQVEKALVRNPDLIDAYLEKARLLGDRREFEAAEETCYKGVDRVKANLSAAKEKAGENQEKIKSLTTAANHDIFRLMRVVAQIENICDRNSRAAEILKEIVGFAPTRADEKDVRFMLGSLCLEMHELDEAEEQADEIQKIDRRDARTNYLRGRVFLARGEKLREKDPTDERATELLDRAVNELVAFTNSKSPLYLYYLGRAYQLRGGRDEQAITELSKALDYIDPGTNEQLAAMAHLSIADIKLRKGALDEAEFHYGEVLKVWRNNPAAKRGLAMVYMLRDKRDQARTIMAGVSQVDPSSGIDYARYVFLSGRTKLALKLVEEEIAKSESKNPKAYYLQGFMYQNVGDYVKAIGSYEEALRLDPAFSAAYIGLAQTYVANNQRDKAIEMLKDVMAQQPRQAEGPFYLGLLHEQLGQDNPAEYDTAIEYYREALNRSRKYIPAYRVARLYLIKGNTDEAIQKWEELKSVAEENKVQLPLARVNLAFAKLIGGRQDEAITELKALQDAFKERPNAFVAQRLLAELYAGNIENARKILQGVSGITRNNLTPFTQFITQCEKEPDKTAVRQVLTAMLLSAIDANESDPKKAIERIDQALQVWPNNLWLHKRRAETYLAIAGGREAVVEECNQMIDLSPPYAMPHIYLAQLAEAGDEIDRAMSEYRKAADLDPEAIMPRIRLAALKLNKKLYDDVHKLVAEIRAIDPNNTTALELQAAAYEAQEQPEKVMKIIAEIDRARPDDPRNKLRMARAKLRAGDYDKAIDICNEGLRLSKDDTNFRLVKAKALISRGATGDVPEAIRVLREGLAINDYNYQLYIQLAEIYRATPVTIPAALEVLQSGLRKMPDNAELNSAMAATYILAGKLDEAEECLDKLLADRDNELTKLMRYQIDFLRARQLQLREQRTTRLNEIVAAVSDLAAKAQDKGLTREAYQARLLLGNIYLHGLEDKTLATRMFEEASRIQPNASEPYARLAPIYFGRGLYDDCERALSQLSAHPFNTSRIAICKHAAGSLQEAERIGRAALEQPPQHKDTCRLALANILLDAGKVDEAMAEIDKASQWDRRLLASYKELAGKLTGATRHAVTSEVNRALFYKLSGLHRESADHFAAALQESKTNNVFLLMQLARERLEAKQLDEAAEHLKQLVDLQPDYVPALINLGNVYELQQKLTDAIHTYKLALDKEPKNVTLASRLALMYQRGKKFSEAQSYYKRALELAPDRSDLHHDLGSTYEAQGLIDKALEEYEKAIQLAPKDVGTFAAYNNAAWHYATKKNPDLKRALLYARAAFDMRPELPEVRDTLGWVYFLRENYEEAESQLEIAARGLPKNGSVQYHYAAALAKNGKPDAAVRVLELSIDLDFPMEYDKKLAQELLNELKTANAHGQP